jgi:regulator of protease activity HflC (stomatin/prohibitin superfamily)
MAFFELFVFFAILLVVIFLLMAFKAVIIVRPYERGLIERFGKYQRAVNPGIVILIPFVETIKKIDIRERLIDVPPQEVITRDNAVVVVDAIVYFEVFDPRKVEYNVENFEDAATRLAQTTLRDVIGSMELDETLISRERINTALKQVLDKATEKWGVNVTRVEIKRVDPPKDITDAMSKQMKAERTRRAAILEAEGFKQAEILKAEGSKQAEILKAEGKADAIKKVSEAKKYQEIAVAEGEARAIESVYSAIHKGMPTNDLIAIKYLETLGKVADGRATKIFLPMETSGILGSVSMLGELFRGGEKEKEEGMKKKKKKKRNK